MELADLKSKLQNVLSATKYCGICLGNSEEVFDFDKYVPLSNGTVITISEILQGVFGNMESSMFFSKYICSACKHCAVNSYNFINNAKETAKKCETYLMQLQSQTEDIFKHFNSKVTNVLIILDDFANLIKNEEGKYEDVIVHNGGSISCYTCDCCVENIGSREHLLKHLNNLKCMKYKKYSKCPHCLSDCCKHEKYLIAFNKEKILKRGMEKVKCLDCNYRCESLKAMIRHVNKEHLHIKLDCNTCGKAFYYRANLIEHIKKCRGTEKNFACEKCPATFQTKLQATMHRRQHAEAHWKCYVCTKWFLEKKHLSQHINMFHKFDVYECSVCQKDCGDEINLHAHLSTHKPGEKHKCIVCDIQFNGRTLYIEHIRTTNHLRKVKGEKEIENRKVLCTICHVTCEDMSAYLAHRKTHKADEKHKCNVCKIVFDSKLEYTRHSRKLGHKRIADPDKSQALKCSYCDFKTYSRTTLELHINCKHLKYLPHECHVCGKGFATTHALDSHVKRHSTKLKQNVVEKGCEVCGKWFRSKIAWQKHMRLHTGERPYPCDLCNQSFISASHRTAHKFRQHMDKTFRCPLCDSMFHTLGNVRSHFKKAHWKRPDKFDYRKLENLTEEVEELFRDRRMLQ